MQGNIGAHYEISNLEVAKLILKELGKKEDLITFVEDRKGHDLRYGVDTTKIRKELGFEPAVSFEDAVRKTIAWYVEHRDWWNH